MRRVLFVALTPVLAALVALALFSASGSVAAPPVTPAADLSFTAHQSGPLPLAVAPTDPSAYPDPDIAASATAVISTSNTGIRISELNGSNRAFASLASFFTPAGTLPPTLYKCKVAFWEAQARFVVCATAIDRGAVKNSQLLIAVSNDSDPADLSGSEWRFGMFPTGSNLMAANAAYSEIAGTGYMPGGGRFLVTYDDTLFSDGSFDTNRVDSFTAANITGAGAITAPTTDTGNDQPAAYGAPAGTDGYHLIPCRGEGNSSLISVGNPFAGSSRDGGAAYAVSGTGAVSTGVFFPFTPWQAPPPAALKGSLDGIRLGDELHGFTSHSGFPVFAQTVQATTPPARSAVRVLSGSGLVTETTDAVSSFYMPSLATDARGNAILVFHGSNANSTVGVYHQRILQGGAYVEEPRLTAVSPTTFDPALQNSPFHTPWGGSTAAALDLSTGNAIWTHAELALDCEAWKTEVDHLPLRQMAVYQPNGGETFQLDGVGPPAVATDNVDIQWSRGLAGVGEDIRIDLSRDGGGTWSNIVAHTADDGQFTWAATGPITTQARIRVQVVTNPGNVVIVEDASDADFTITSRSATSGTPNTPPTLPAAIPDNWQNEGDWVDSPLFLPADLRIDGLEVTVDISHAYIPDLEVYLVHPDGTSVVLHDQSGIPSQPPGGTPPAFGVRTYPVPTAPDAAGGGLAGVTFFRNALLGKRTRHWVGGVEKPWLLRVRDLNAGNLGQLNTWSLRAVGPRSQRLAITHPNGGEQLIVGQDTVITWSNDTNHPVQGNVNLQLSRNGGADGFPETLNMLPIPVDAGQFTWNVTGPVTANALVRIVPLDEGPTEPGDWSDAPFRIRDPFVEVTFPNAPGINLLTGQGTTITWNRFPTTGNVKIELLDQFHMVVDTIAASTANDGSEPWTPSTARPAAYILITPLGMGAPAPDESDNAFCIVTKSLTVTAPGAPGPATVDVDTQTNIDWTTTGIAGNVKIELSRDNGANYEEIAAAVGHGSAPYVWTVTGPPTTQAKIRVTSLTDGTVSDVGDVFTIRQAGITITKPVAADKLAISSIFDIQWTSTAPLTSMDNVKIELQRNGGAWEPISASTANDGTFKWTVTGPARDTCVFRITALTYPSTSDLSDVFQIISPSLTVVQPNGGEGLGIGSVYKVKWDSAPKHDGVDNLSYVRIFISRTGLAGAFTEEITPNPGMGLIGVPNTGEFDWTVTGPPTTDAAIEIRTFLSTDGGMTFNLQAPFPSQTDRSDAVFRIDTQQIVVGQPMAGDKWLIGDQKTIQWSAVGVPGNVKILVQRGMADQEITPMGGVPSNQGTFNWTVTSPAHTGAIVRVESILNGAVFGTSGAFDIVDYGLSITQPSGDTWGVGTKRKIKWTFASGFTGSSEVLIQRMGEMMPTPLGSAASPGGNGEFEWTVAGPVGAATVTVRVNGTVPLVSATAPVTIVDPTITVTAPTMGQNLRTGLSFNITWTSNGLTQEGGGTGNVKISVSRDAGAYQTIIGSTPNDGSYTWNPVTGPDSANTKIKVESVELPSVFDESDSFAIATPVLQITAPTQGTSAVIGDSLNISWNATNVDGPLDIYIIRNNGAPELIASGVSVGLGTYAWDVTGDGGGNGGTNNRIRLVDTGATGASSEMAGPFTIVKPSITVGFPNGGQTIVKNTVQTITWSSIGIPGGANVKIELLQSDSPVQTIAASTANDGSHSWTPTLSGTDFKIRISRVGSPAASDDSNSAFTVVNPTLTVTSPNGGEKVKKGKQLPITWTSSTIGAVGGGGLVDVQLSRDGGVTFETIIPDTANDGAVNWFVATPLSKKCRIKVIWKTDTSVNDTSNGDFQITKK